jgi:hypothetical protein
MDGAAAKLDCEGSGQFEIGGADGAGEGVAWTNGGGESPTRSGIDGVSGYLGRGERGMDACMAGVRGCVSWVGGRVRAHDHSAPSTPGE